MSNTTSSANVRIHESKLVDLLAQAMCHRIARDYDTLEDTRSNREILQDLIRRAKHGEGDLCKYLQEMLDGNTYEIANTYMICIP